MILDDYIVEIHLRKKRDLTKVIPVTMNDMHIPPELMFNENFIKSLEIMLTNDIIKGREGSDKKV
jgi:hypothetical protein